MYFVSLALFLFVLPVASVVIETFVVGAPANIMMLVGKWFVFWGVGVRLFLAGVMQILRPQFTAEGIFGIKDPASYGIVREVGFGNLSFGTFGLASLAVPGWAAAVAGGLYYGLGRPGPSDPRRAKSQGTGRALDRFLYVRRAGRFCRLALRLAVPD